MHCKRYMEGNKELNRDEQQAAEVITNLFRTKFFGNENAVKKDVFVKYLANKHSLAITERRLRVIIAHIRYNDLLNPHFVVSDVSVGYWLSDNEQELNTFLDKQLNRMTNQFQNLKLLHERIRYGKKSLEAQANLF